MMRLVLTGALMALAMPVAAQDSTAPSNPLGFDSPLLSIQEDSESSDEASGTLQVFPDDNQSAPADLAEAVSSGTGAVLRGLDKINGNVVDIDIATGGVARMGGLVIRLRDCRYPQGNQAGDAFAFLTITEPEKSEEVPFEGWMIASAPALNAMDHARYDIWVLRCTTS